MKTLEILITSRSELLNWFGQSQGSNDPKGHVSRLPLSICDSNLYLLASRLNCLIHLVFFTRTKKKAGLSLTLSLIASVSH
jgi:hypothetical protein